MAALWKKIDRVGIENFPCRLEDSDSCYYARDYISEGGYKASEANQLISNFKKTVDKKGNYEWRYKEEAIRKFARELAAISNIADFLVIGMPSSKAKTDPLYDSRIEDVLCQLKRQIPSVEVEFPFSAIETATPAHHGGTRDVDTIYSNLNWAGLKSTKTDIILVDDVLTTGAHFKACKKLILEHIPAANVHGLFWARTVWPEEEFDFDVDF